MLNIVSFSGGKDSTAMLLRMIEEGMQIDYIIFVDTGMEYPQIYEHINVVEEYIGRPITRLKSEYSFEYLFAEKPLTEKAAQHAKEKGYKPFGYGWPTPLSRWCTAQLKRDVLRKFYQSLNAPYREFVGIAFDEQYRLERKVASVRTKVYPLNDWKMTEADCLAYCKERGFDFGGIYEKMSRVSCWCCPLADLNHFRLLRKDFPQLWQKLAEMDERTPRFPFKDVGVKALDVRFALEEAFVADGKSIRSKEFYKALKGRTAK